MSIPSKWTVYLDGKEVPDAFGAIDFFDQNIGIFESLRTYHGRIFKEEEHLARLADSARTSGFSGKWNLPQIRRVLRKSLAAYFKKKHRQGDLAKEAFIRLTLFEKSVFVLIGQRHYPEKMFEEGVSLQTSPVRRSLSNAMYPEAKTSAYQNNILAGLEPRPPGIYEWIFMDRDGYVSEVSIGNIFIVEKGNHIKTPPPAGILNGLTRQFVLQCAGKMGFDVSECPFTRHELYNAAESFLTNTSWEILPVVKIDGRAIGSGRPGSVTRKLRNCFRQRVKKEYSR